MARPAPARYAIGMNVMPSSSLAEFTDFTGCTVVITGASGVVGAGIAERFAEAGARVVIHYRSGRARAEALQRKIEDNGGQAVTISADVGRKQEVQQMFADIATDQPVDVLINNAGHYPLSSIVDMTTAEWDAVMCANMRSTFLCTQSVIAYMKAARHKSIVNISSIESQHVMPMHSHYTAAKAGVNMFTRSAASELGRYGIRCNAVLPGLIWRQGIEAEWPEGVAGWRKSAPLERLGRAEDVANACLFLSSTAAAWITGAELRVDGGVLSSKAF